MPNILKISKVNALPAMQDRENSCLYVVKSNPNVNTAELYITHSNTLEVVEISTVSLIQSIAEVQGKTSNPLIIGIGHKDNETTLTTGTNLAYVRSPRAFILKKVRASVFLPSTSGDLTIDVKVNGVTLVSGSLLTVDANETSSVTSTLDFNALLPVNGISIPDDALITIDIVSPGTGATGLIVQLQEG